MHNGEAPATRYKVLVVDDHPAVRQALTAVINEDPALEVCGTAASAAEALDQAQAHQPDVAVVDLMLDQSHGLDVIRRLAGGVAEDVRIVVYSFYDERIYAERALQAGANAYLMKTEPTAHVVEAIHSAARGEVYLSPVVARRLLSSLTGRRRPATPALSSLTDRELTVFQMLGHGYSVPSISDSLSLNRKTVEAHRRRIKEKLGFETVNELLQFAIRYSLGPSPKAV